jgi:enterochelin esterase-like enzyme
MKITALNSGVMLCMLALTYPAFGADATPAPATDTSSPAPAATMTPASAAGSAGTAGGRGRGGRGGRGGAPATPAELAEIAKLAELPVYTSNAGDGDYSLGPDYTPAPELTPKDGVPKGKVVAFTMNAADSKFYPPTGLRGATPTRQVTVYIPSQYVAGKPAPVIVSADAYGARDNQLPNILDNMIADHRLPTMIAVMIANGGGDGPGSERGLEYDTVSGKFAEFVEAEVLPMVEKNYGVTISKDPDARMTLGGSSGGTVAFSMAWYHPELYHRVVTYSGTYVNQQPGPDAPHGAWEYHDHFIPESPAKPLRIWLEVAQNDNGATTAGAGFHNWVIANQHMATVLKAKGYHYQLVYAKNAGHTDRKVISQTLAQALEYVWKGYPISTPAAK